MPPTLATHADHTVWQQSGYRPPAPTGLTVDEYVRAAARSLAAPVRVVGTARSARLVVRLAEAGLAVHAVRPDPAAAPLGFPPANPAEAGRPDPYAPLSVPPPALAGWAAICGLGPLDRHPAAPVARFLGVADADLATFAALVRDPRWFRSADPERPLAAGRLHAFLRLKGKDRPGAVVRWALAAVGRAAPPDRPEGVARRIAAGPGGPAAAARYLTRTLWAYWLARVTTPELFDPARAFSGAELAAWAAFTAPRPA